MKTKPFDCVEMKRKAAEKIYQTIKTMTFEEELRFWNAAADLEEDAAAVHIKQTNTTWVRHDDLKKELGV
jgi:hypothetical protein